MQLLNLLLVGLTLIPTGTLQAAPPNAVQARYQLRIDKVFPFRDGGRN
jgi:hypothetical protein